jgi:metal-dependent hydrolase (beta-lactamase superfamily II)
MRTRVPGGALVLFILGCAFGGRAHAAEPAHVKALKITVLVTNLAGDAYAGGGEWGFAAVVEADGHRILYDTGASPDLALRNAQTLKIDLATIEDVVLSHNHRDHTGGLLTLRRELAKTNPRALSRAHVGAGIFVPRIAADGRRNVNYAEQIKAEYEATGGKFVVHDGPAELFPGVWLTGPVPRAHPEHNWQPGVKIDSATGPVEDTLAEDSALAYGPGFRRPHRMWPRRHRQHRGGGAAHHLRAVAAGGDRRPSSVQRRRHDARLDRRQAEGDGPQEPAGRPLHGHRIDLAPAARVGAGP